MPTDNIASNGKPKSASTRARRHKWFEYLVANVLGKSATVVEDLDGRHFRGLRGDADHQSSGRDRRIVERCNGVEQEVLQRRSQQRFDPIDLRLVGAQQKTNSDPFGPRQILEPADRLLAYFSEANAGFCRWPALGQQS